MRSDGLLMLARELINKAIDLQELEKEAKVNETT
jgi:hypothetical protein